MQTTALCIEAVGDDTSGADRWEVSRGRARGGESWYFSSLDAQHLQSWLHGDGWAHQNKVESLLEAHREHDLILTHTRDNQKKKKKKTLATYSWHLDLLKIPRLSVPLVSVRRLRGHVANLWRGLILDILDRKAPTHLGRWS